MQLEESKLDRKNSLLIELDDELCENDSQSTSSVYSTASLNSQQVVFRQKSIELIMLLTTKLDLEKDTLFIAITSLDRLLETGLEEKYRNSSIMALTLLFISAKVNQIYPPTLDEFLSIMSKPVNRNQVVMLQAFIFEKLSYDVMSFATVYSEFKQITQSVKRIDPPAERKCFKIIKREVSNFSLMRYGYKAFALGVISIFYPNEIRKYQLEVANYATIIADQIIQEDNKSHSSSSGKI